MKKSSTFCDICNKELSPYDYCESNMVWGTDIDIKILKLVFDDQRIEDICAFCMDNIKGMIYTYVGSAKLGKKEMHPLYPERFKANKENEI